MNQIDKRSHLLRSGGFHRFYDSLAEHLAKVRALRIKLENEENRDYDDNDDDGIPPLNVNNMLGPITILLSYFLVAAVVFIIEIIVFFINERRNRQNHPQRR